MNVYVAEGKAFLQKKYEAACARIEFLERGQRADAERARDATHCQSVIAETLCKTEREREAAEQRGQFLLAEVYRLRGVVMGLARQMAGDGTCDKG